MSQQNTVGNGPNIEVIEQAAAPLTMKFDGEFVPPSLDYAKYQSGLRCAFSYIPHCNDVFICTYMKCGTTLMQNIVYQLLHDGKSPTDNGLDQYAASPWLEADGSEKVESVNEPRVIKTHFRCSKIPYSANAKYIWVLRNPKDVAVSLFHHVRGFKWYNFKNGHFHDFLKTFIAGKVPYGDYFDHLYEQLQYLEQRPNTMLVFYEALLQGILQILAFYLPEFASQPPEKREVIREIARFLGGSAPSVVADECKLDQVLRKSSLEEMASMVDQLFPKYAVQRFPDSPPFIRKGIVGDWRNYFTKEDSDTFDEWFKRKTERTVVEHWWKSEMAWIH